MPEAPGEGVVTPAAAGVHLTGRPYRPTGRPAVRPGGFPGLTDDVPRPGG
ncbi:hypothetical protein [Streptomyces marianii]|nr:hypothetical protein [Streptomyces marianii]